MNPKPQLLAEWKRVQLEQYEYDHLDNGRGGIDDLKIDFWRMYDDDTKADDLDDLEGVDCGMD